MGQCSPKFTPTCAVPLGYVKTAAGNGCPLSCDGAEFNAMVHYPDAVAVDPDNAEYLLIGDYGANDVRRMVVSSGVVTTIADQYTWYHPLGMAIDPNTRDVYVSDMHRISRIALNDQTSGTSAQTVVGSTCK